MRRQCLVAAGFVAAIIGAAGQVQAEGLAERVPADAVAFAGWAGSDAAGTAYDGSHLKAFVDVLNLPQFVSQQIKARAAKQPAATQNAQEQKLGEEVLGAIAHAPTGLYFGPFEFPANGQPEPKVALFSKVGAARAETLAPRLQVELDRNKAAGAPARGAVAAGDYLLVYVGDAKISDRLSAAAAPADNLAASAGYQKAMAQLGPGAADAPAVIYVDAGAAVKTLATAVDRSNNTQARRIFPPLVDGLGLSSMTQCAWAGRFDGADWRSDLFLGMAGDRSGMLAFLDFPAIEDATLKLIPKAATTAGVIRFDGVKLLEQISAAADAANPNGAQRIDQAMNQIWTFTGIDFKQDFFPGLGDAFVYYGSPSSAGNSIGGLTILNRLRDAKKAQTAMEAMESFVNAAIQQQDPNSKAQFQAQALPAPWQDVTAHVITLPNLAPSWAIRGGVLFFSLSVQALEDSLEMTTRKEASILENPKFLAMRKKLGDRAFFSFGFEDLPASAPETYQLVSRAIARAARGGAAPAFVLPPLDRITPTLAPAMQISWSDAAGYHAQGTGPFPLAAYLNPLQLMGLAAQAPQLPRGAPARGRFGVDAPDGQLP